MNLFIDTSNKVLAFILEKNNEVIDQFYLNEQSRVSEIINEELKKFLSKNKISLNHINNFYITKGPGTYTGIRVAIAIIKTIAVLDPSISVFTINSLLFQAGMGEKISLIDARGGNYFVAIYNNGKTLIEEQLINSKDLNVFCEPFVNYDLVDEYSSIDFVKNYRELKTFFKKESDVPNLEPLYIKSFI